MAFLESQSGALFLSVMGLSTFFKNGTPVIDDNVEVEDDDADGNADSVEIKD